MTTYTVAPSARTTKAASTRLGWWNTTPSIAPSERAKSMTLRTGFGNGHRKTNAEQPKPNCTLKQDLECKQHTIWIGKILQRSSRNKVRR